VNGSRAGVCRRGLSASALLAVALAGCSAAQFADVANLRDPRTIVDESIDGGAVTLKRGSALILRLPVPDGDGYRWELAPLAITPVGSPVQIDYQPTAGPAALPVVSPYSGWLARYNVPGSEPSAIVYDASRPTPHVTQGDALLRLRGMAPGRATVQLDYRRTDPPGTPPLRTVRFDVAVVP
jgi:predicted secreted protein